MSTEDKFNAAVNVIKSLPKHGSYQPSNDMMLRFYSYFKQATEGPCTQSKPAFWEVIKKAKWDAWKNLGNMSREQAMTRYVEDLKQIIETMSFTDDVADFMEKLGPFYEMAELNLPVKIACKLPKDRPEARSLEAIPREESTFQETASIITKDTFSEEFYSGSDSEEDGDQFSDPVENDGESIHSNGLPEVEMFVVGASNKPIPQNGRIPGYSNGFPENNVSTDEEAATATVSKHKRLLNGKKNTPDDGREMEERYNTRGGGDLPMGSSSNQDQGPTARHGSAHVPRSVPGNRGADQGNYSNPTRPGNASSGGSRRGPGGGPHGKDDVSEQIALTLLKLQRDMENVLARLNTLEALTVAQHNMARVGTNGILEPERKKNTPFWWPFGNLSGKTVIFLIVWPAVWQLAMKLIARRWAHRKLLQKHC